MTTHDGGKGDAKRPLTVDEETFNKNWDAIFNKDDQAKTQFEIEADNDHIEILATIPFGR